MDYLSLHRDTFNALAGTYQERRAKYCEHQKEVLQPFIEALKERFSNPRVLDVGCGVGTDSGLFLAEGFRVEAIDLSEEMAKYARENALGATVHAGDFLTFEFESLFEGINASAMIHLFPKEDALEVLKKCRALLAPSGVAFLSTSVSEKSKEGLETKDAYGSDRARFRKHWTREEFEEAIRAARFRVRSWHDDNDPCIARSWMSALAEAD